MLQHVCCYPYKGLCIGLAVISAIYFQSDTAILFISLSTRLVVTMQNIEEVKAKILVLDRKFCCACRQVMLLTHRIEDKQVRFDTACRRNQRSWQRSLRMQLSVMEGVREMYYEYASRKADELEELQDILVAAGEMSETYEDLDWNDEG